MTDHEKLKAIIRARLQAEVSYFEAKYFAYPEKLKEDFSDLVERSKAERIQNKAAQAMWYIGRPEEYDKYVESEALELGKGLGATLPIFEQIIDKVRCDLEETARDFRQDYDDDPSLIIKEAVDAYERTVNPARQMRAKEAMATLADPKLLARHITEKALALAEEIQPAMPEWEKLSQVSVEQIENLAQQPDLRNDDTLDAQDILANERRLSREVFKRNLSAARSLSRARQRSGFGYGY